MIRSDVYAESSGEILERGLEAADDLLLVNPTRQTMRELVSTYRDGHDQSTVRLFADSQPLKDLIDDFLVASTIADLVVTETLAVRTLETVPRNSLVLTEDFLVSLIERDGSAVGLTTTDESFVVETYDHYDRRWRRAEEFALRTPPLSHIRETLGVEIGPQAVDDFDRIITTLDSTQGNGDDLDEVTIALLVAANNGELLYDISRWGEDIKLASKATFSRTKNRLEDENLIDTEKVPIDVGRPRLRLMLADGTLDATSIEDVAKRAQARLG